MKPWESVLSNLSKAINEHQAIISQSAQDLEKTLREHDAEVKAPVNGLDLLRCSSRSIQRP